MRTPTNPFTASSSVLLKATIHPQVLINLSRAGRNLLYSIVEGGILEKSDGNSVLLDKIAIVNYYQRKFGADYANTMNVNRGIQNLVECGVMAPSTTDGVYFINANLLSK